VTRLAARLAWREVRRRPGRTVLVCLLVALPVFAMSVASIAYRTADETSAESYERTAGRADAFLIVDGVAAPTDEELAAALPPDSSWRRGTYATSEVVGGSERRWMTVSGLDLRDPVFDGIAELVDGRPPAATGELALDPRSAAAFGVEVGDTLELVLPDSTWTVTGLVRQRDSLRGAWVVVAPGDVDVFVASVGAFDAPGSELVFVDLAEGATARDRWDAFAALRPWGWVQIPELGGGGPGVDTRAMVWGWVAGVMALAATGIVVAAAFATSARRQMVLIGQLAANGADRRVILRTLGLQGFWSGLLGSVAGVLLAVAALAPGRPLVELVVNRRLGSWDVAPLDLVVIVATGAVAGLVAALVPARSASRVPVLAALAGRRPMGAVPPGLAPLSLSLFGVGLLLLGTVSAALARDGDPGNGDVLAVTAILGGLGVLAGMCCSTPFLVAGLGRMATSAGGTWRLAARSLARTRTRSAAVVTAIAVTVAAAAVTVTLVETLHEREERNDRLLVGTPPDTVVIDGLASDEVGAATLVAKVLEVTDGSVTRTRAVDGRTPSPGGERALELTVADPAVLELLELSPRDRSALAEQGILTWGSGSPGGLVTVSVLADGGLLPVQAVVARDDVATPAILGFMPGLITTERLAELDLSTVTGPVVVRAPTDLTEEQLRAIEVLASVPRSQEPVPTVFLPTNPGDGDLPAGTLQLVASIVALAFTLGVVATGLGLAAAESRDERDVLLAVGARPSTLWGVAGRKALWLAAAGVLVGIPTGLLPLSVVLQASDTTDAVVAVPWPTLAAFAVVIPLLAGVVTGTSSALAQRFRPVRIGPGRAD
jgi:putative ABC transport system permease protein